MPVDEVWSATKVFLARVVRFKRRNRVKRYGFAVILVVVTFLLKSHFQGFLGHDSAFLMVSFIVAASSWYGGFGPGIFATILSAGFVYITYLSRDPTIRFVWEDVTVITIFLIEGIMISLVSEARFQTEEQKDEFIGFVAHELKNPLAALKGFTSLLTMYAAKNKDEKALLYGGKINDQAEKILELTNDLLDITKIHAGKLSYTDSTFKLKDVVKEAIFHQQLMLKDRLIEFHGKSSHLLFADKYRIGQVITNLLTNALKYSPDTKHIVVSLKDTAKSVIVSVKDFGIGIAPRDQTKIFDKFYRTGGARRSKFDGLGLGLYISSQIVSRHNGKLWVRSKQGKGTTFYLELPLTRVTHQPVLTSFFV
jgi:signal transduction histidine kinase